MHYKGRQLSQRPGKRKPFNLEGGLEKSSRKRSHLRPRMSRTGVIDSEKKIFQMRKHKQINEAGAEEE